VISIAEPEVRARHERGNEYEIFHFQCLTSIFSARL